MNEEVCCPKFNPEPWDEKEVVWKDKLFVKDNVMALFHIPLNIGQVIGRMWEKVKSAGAELPTEQFLLLSKDPTPWRTEQYMTVSKEVPNMENVKISGTFLTRVFEGPFSDAPKWVEEVEKYVSSKGRQMQDLYFYYTTCPKCAKKYGKNYVVAFAKV